MSEAEAAFRIHKSELSLRPNWHQKEERVLAHILVCFPPPTLCGKPWSSGSNVPGSGTGRERSWRSWRGSRARMSFCRLQGVARWEIRLRCVVRPDKAQAALLNHLGLRLPERLKVRGMVAKV